MASAFLYCAVTALLLPGAAWAQTVEFEFAGEVSFALDSNAVLDGSVVAGSPIRGFVRYDASLADSNVAEPAIGSYHQPIPPGAFTVEVGTYTIVIPALQLTVYDEFEFFGPVDIFNWLIEGIPFAMPGVPSASLVEARFGITDADATLFPSDALPDAPIDFGVIEDGSFLISGCLDSERTGGLCEPEPTISISGTLTHVPEPAGSAIAALGAIGALVARRFRRA